MKPGSGHHPGRRPGYQVSGVGNKDEPPAAEQWRHAGLMSFALWPKRLLFQARYPSKRNVPGACSLSLRRRRVIQLQDLHVFSHLLRGFGISTIPQALVPGGAIGNVSSPSESWPVERSGMGYEYKCVGAPEEPKRQRGVRGWSDRAALAMQECISAEAVDGWEYLRMDTLPVEEKDGFFSRARRVQRAVLVFRRRLGQAPRMSAERADAVLADEATSPRHATDQPGGSAMRLSADRGSPVPPPPGHRLPPSERG